METNIRKLKVPEKVMDEILKMIDGEDVEDPEIHCKWCIDNKLTQEEAHDLIGCVIYNQCLNGKDGVDIRSRYPSSKKRMSNWLDRRSKVTLECGHTVARWDVGKRKTKYTYCDTCKKLVKRVKVEKYN